MKKWLFCTLVASLAMLLLVAKVGRADPAGSGASLSNIFAVLTDPASGLPRVLRELRAVQAALTTRVEVVADTDEAACAAGSAQCNDEGSGHTHEAASGANHNPVAIVVLVTQNGQPVNGLTASSFFLHPSLGAAGGPAVVLCPNGGTGCASGSALFQTFGDGTYALYAHPGPIGVNWRPGSYFSTLQVVLPGGGQGQALVRFDIPAGSARTLVLTTP